MKLQRNKTLSTIALILILTLSAFLASMPTVNAHTPPWSIPMYAYIATSTSVIGVNEPVWLTMWLDKVPATAGGFGGDRWRGLQVAVTKPDGTSETLGPFTSDPIGTKSIQYTPAQVGTYYFQFSWPGQTLTNGTGTPEGRGLAFVGDYYQPATSEKISLTVQQQPLTRYPDYPLPGPNDYWTRPIEGEGRGWSSLASNWLRGSQLVGNFQPYGGAPDSAHIVWTKVLSFGGLVGDQFGDIPYGTDDYESPWSGGIIIQGRLYYNTPMYPKYGYYCVDLRTGEQIWYKNGTDNGLGNPFTQNPLTGPAISRLALDLRQTYLGLSFGQLYWYYSLNGQGVVPYLWMTSGSTWYMLDALTGNWILTLKNVPGGTATTAADGSLLLYSYNGQKGQLLCWNSSQSIPPLGAVSSEAQQWKPRVGATIDAVNDTSWTVIGPWNTTVDQGGSSWTAADVAPRSGYSLNVTTPKLAGSIVRVLDDRVIGATTLQAIGSTGAGSVNSQEINTYLVWALSLKPGQEGTLLWSKNYSTPKGNLTLNWGPMSLDSGVFTMWAKETRQWFGYSLTDGSLLWGPTDSQGAWDMFGMGGSTAYGKLYSCGYGGVLYAYDMKTGKLLWNYSSPNIGEECPYGQYPLSIGAIADGKIYMYSSEHSPTKPLWRGSRLRCLDANTGKELWTILHWSRGSIAIADGYLVSANTYDGLIYCFGKGNTATTVTAPVTAVPQGTSVLIQGTVTDQSPGAAGTPAVSDASMSQWMEYEYMQKPIPTNATGVPVTLTAIDPNGNTQNIGTVTSNILGNYAIAWTPPVPGVYTITATFAGSNSYFSSQAGTALDVSKAPVAQAPASPSVTSAPAPTSAPSVSPSVAPTPPTPPSNPASSMTLYIVVAAAAIIIVVAAAALVLRRRK